MIDRMIDRCQRICGSAEGTCFVNNRDQLKCIADMVINKTAGITMTLDFLMMESDPQMLKEGIHDSIRAANELANWIKYMQLVQDLRQMSSLVLDSDQREKRKEIRYPVPERFESLKVRVVFDGAESEGKLENFSSSGLRFTSNKPIKPGTRMQVIVIGASSSVSLAAEARYCGDPGKPKFAIGALIEPDPCGGSVNFFNDAYRLLMEDYVNLP